MKEVRSVFWKVQLDLGSNRNITTCILYLQYRYIVLWVEIISLQITQ